jgi:hypothetical protein
MRTTVSRRWLRLLWRSLGYALRLLAIGLAAMGPAPPPPPPPPPAKIEARASTEADPDD